MNMCVNMNDISPAERLLRVTIDLFCKKRGRLEGNPRTLPTEPGGFVNGEFLSFCLGIDKLHDKCCLDVKRGLL